MPQNFKTLSLCLAATLVASLANAQSVSHDPRTARTENAAMASLQPKQGLKLQGEVAFSEEKDGVRVKAQISGLQPNSVHGFHVHDGKVCEAPGFESALGHFNPGGKPHAGVHDESRHAGDLGNVKADAQGRVALNIVVKGIAVGKGDANIVGRAVILHEKADDFKTQPTGDAGGRIACGVIELKTRN